MTETERVLDGHVHFWEPVELEYPWLAAHKPLQHAFTPEDHAEAVGDAPVDALLFVEANPSPHLGVTEAWRVQRLSHTDPRIAGVVAFVDLTDEETVGPAMEELTRIRLVRGIRQNIQGNPPGFALQPAFVEGVREAGRRGWVFDLCATHDQLEEVVRLVELCPDTRFVLDHCGKPAIRHWLFDPWREQIARLAGYDRVSCKVSGLLTESDPATQGPDALLPYVMHVEESFGRERLIYGSDWPVLTLAGSYADWYHFTRSFTRGWTAEERRAFYGDTARRVYGLG